jgi:hypothetical protein
VYDFVKGAPLADLAWEFLRRNPGYRSDYKGSQGTLERLPDRLGNPVFREKQIVKAARQWGLHHTPDPGERADAAGPFWVLRPAPVSITFPIGRRQRSKDLSFLLHESVRPRLFIATKGGHYLDLTLSRRPYRLPVQNKGRALTLTVSDIGRLPEATALLSQMAEAPTKQGPAQTLPATWTAERLRLRLALIALDGMAARATYREIAAAIFGLKRANEAWASSSRALKDQIRRACQRGKELMAGAYRKLIAGLEVPDEET